MATFIKNKKFLLILFLLVFASSSTALALELDWPLSPGGTALDDDSDVGDMIQYFYEWAIALGGLATFVSLVFGGFKYLSSMGRPEVMKEAKSQITSAFVGLILLLSSWLILNIINPDLTTFHKTSYNLQYLIDNPPGTLPGELPGCDYVEVYPLENFGGSPLQIPLKNPPNDYVLEGTDGWKVFGIGAIGSVKAFSKAALEDFGCDSPPCPCEGHACGCVLELYAATPGVPCGDKLGDVPAWDKDVLAREGEGQQINCVRLSGIACKCREVNEKDECTTLISPDTAWGDNDYNCFGDNQTENNKRCVDGKCVTCEGTIFPDGCGGCSNDVMVPGYTGGSEWACWYAGIKSDTGASCNQSCKYYAGKSASCVQANWNDSWCGMCYKLTGASGCTPSLYPGTPWSYIEWLRIGWPVACHFRFDFIDQRCSDISTGGGRRLCVCDR